MDEDQKDEEEEIEWVICSLSEIIPIYFTSDFFSKVVNVAKKIVFDTKRMTNTTQEDDIIEGAKGMALSTFGRHILVLEL